MTKVKVLKLGMLVMVAAFAVSVVGCTTFVASGLQAKLATDGQKYEKIGDFSEKIWANKFLGWGVNGGTLFNITAEATDPRVREVVEKQIKWLEGDGAVNLKITYGSNPLQWILTNMTFGIWVPSTVTVSGTVVKAVN